MTQKNLNKQLFFTTILLIAVIVLFQFSELDLLIQNNFYNLETKNWLIDKEDQFFKLYFYDGPKNLLIILEVTILFSLILFRKKIITEYKKGLIIVFLSGIFVPLTIGTLKDITNTPCPSNVVNFGGIYPEIKVFDSYPKDFVQISKAKCWPAGHASGGFALMSLYFLFKNPINRRIALFSSFILAWSMGNYKMLIGDHYISHTIITMLFAWIIILIIVKFVSYIQNKNS